MKLTKKTTELIDLLITNHIDSPVKFSCASIISTYVEDFVFRPHYFPFMNVPIVLLQNRQIIANEILAVSASLSMITGRERRKLIEQIVRSRLKRLSKQSIIKYDKSEQQWHMASS